MVSLSCYAIVPEQVEPEKYGRVAGLIGAAAPAFVMAGQMIMGAIEKSTLEQKMITIIIVQLIGGFLAALTGLLVRCKTVASIPSRINALR